MICHPERSLACFLRQTESKDLQFHPIDEKTVDGDPGLLFVESGNPARIPATELRANS